MRKSLLDALFPKTRQAVLNATVMNYRREWYLSDLARHLKVQPSSLQRELSNLVAAGILRRRDEGNRTYYKADIDCPVFGDLYEIFMKTVGLRDVLAEKLEPFAGRIRVAFVYGSIARAEENSTSDVDVMIIGEVGLADLALALRSAENLLMRTVNPSIYTPKEIAEKLAAGHHFLTTVMSKEKLFVIGSKDDLAAITERKPSADASD